MRRLLLAPALLALGLFTAPLAAQTPCSKLAVDGTGAPGTNLTFKLGSPDANAPAILFIGAKTGTFAIKFGPIGSLELGLAMPFVPLPLGVTDDKGAASVVIPVPKAKIPLTTLYAQGTTMLVKFPPPRITFCTSNVAKFSIGE